MSTFLTLLCKKDSILFKENINFILYIKIQEVILANSLLKYLKKRIKMRSTGYNNYLQSDERQNAILHDKKLFLSGKALTEPTVSEIILNSWQRSKDFGVKPTQVARPVLSEEKLQVVLQENAELLEVALSVIEKMFLPISEEVSALSLASAEGVTLYISNRTAHKSHYPDAKPGAINLEQYRGTNAIGICIFEKKPIEIIGADHFCTVGHTWSCSAAPIFNHNNQLIAVLNVTQNREKYHSHTLGMVQAVVCAISEQLNLRALLKRQEAILELIDAGVIVLRSGKIEAINKKCMEMLFITEDSIGKELKKYISENAEFERLLQKNTALSDHELRIKLNKGELQCFISIVPTENSGLVLTIREAKRVRNLAAHIIGTKPSYTFNEILGNSKALKKTIDQAKLVAPNMTTVLLLGESGTGKELFAQAIHRGSPRANKPFIVVNCGALPKNLVESELFGYEEGAFTGASKKGKPGKFELADGGTIFLDEIAEMPLDVQVAFLRVLQESEITRIGGKSSRKVSVRVIAATNKNLEEAVRCKSFREDLYYRLYVFPILLPPLREREDDCIFLARVFLKKISQVLGKNSTDFSPEVIESLKQYNWSGNVRELENTIERMVNMANSPLIDMDTLPEHLKNYTVIPNKLGALHENETTCILNILEKTNGNVRTAAALLGMSRGGLYVKFEKLGIDYKKYRKK